MMKRIFYCFIMLFLSYSFLMAQPYENEWIDYTKTYYKFKLRKDGLYRISGAELATAGLDGKDAAGFKLYSRGKEVPVYISTSGAVGNEDYIEFYGFRNDGEFDKQLFTEPEWQLHDYKSLFSDSIGYYLVWDGNNAGTQYETKANSVSNPPAKEEYFSHTTLRVHANQYHAGTPFRLSGVNTYFAEFGDGEGFVSTNIIQGTTDLTTTLKTPAFYKGDSFTPEYRCRVVGRSNDFAALNDHHLRITLNDKLYDDVVYEGYENKLIVREIFPIDMKDEMMFKYSTIGDLGDIDINTIAFSSLTYPREFDFANEDLFYFELNDNEKTYLEITNFSSVSGDAVLYDMTNNVRLEGSVDTLGIYRFYLNAGNNPGVKRKLVMADASEVYKEVADLSSIKFTDFSKANNQGNYMIISNPSLQQGATDWVQEYIDYRGSTEGGGYLVAYANINELYDQFAWGITQNPLAVRNFVNFAIDNWSISPKYLLLLGKSVGYDNSTLNTLAGKKNLVPTFGAYPTASDNMLTVREVDGYFPQLTVGRVSANTSAEVRAYLQKLITYETGKGCDNKDREWTKKAAHLSSAYYAEQNADFLKRLDSYKEAYEAPKMGGSVNTYSQISPTPIPQADFTKDFNNGLSLITLFGHAHEGSWWNFDIKKDPKSYTNYDKYPFMLSASCFVGNIHAYNTSIESVSMPERYVLADSLGAIGYVAAVSFGYPRFLDSIYLNMYKNFSSELYAKPMGDCLRQTFSKLYVTEKDVDDGDVSLSYYRAMKSLSQGFSYEGDPVVVLTGSYILPEYTLTNNQNIQDVKVYNANGGQELPYVWPTITVPSLDSLRFDITVTNNGKVVGANYTVLIERLKPDNSVEIAAQESFLSAVNKTTYSLVAKNLDPENNEGLNTFTVCVDYFNHIAEDCEENNCVDVLINFQPSLCSELPAPFIDPGLPTTFCSDDPAVVLEATPSGGTFTVNGQVLTSFNPATIGEGSHLVSYEYIDQETGCVLYATKIFNVTNIPIPDFTVEVGTVCQGTLNYAVPNEYNQNATYYWNFDGGIKEALPGSGGYSVYWNTPGIKTITMYAVENGCVSEEFVKAVTVIEPLGTTVVTCGTTTQESVCFNWTQVEEATGYELTIKIDGELQTLENLVGSDKINKCFTDLLPGTLVELIVKPLGFGVCGNGIPSNAKVCKAQDCEDYVLEILDLNDIYCTEDAAFDLTGNYDNFDHQFLIDNATATEFNPATIGIGKHTIEYRVTLGACFYTSPIYQVEVFESPVTSIDGNDFFCEGSNTTLFATGSHELYKWSNDEETDFIVVNQADTYSVTVTGPGGCTDVASIDVIMVPAKTPEILTDGPTAICANQVLTLFLDEEYSTYKWSDVNGSTTSSLTITKPGIYGVTVTDDYLCPWTDTIEITEGSIDAPEITVSSGSTEICDGVENVTLSVPDEYDTYTWSTGETEASITVNTANIYSVTVSNSIGCEADQSIVLTAYQVPEPTVTTDDDMLCVNETTVLTVSGDITYDEFLWSNDETTESVTVGEPGVYKVTVTVNGCSDETSITVLAEEDPDPVTDFTTDLSNRDICAGTTVGFTNLTTDADTYLWTITNETSGDSFTSMEEMPEVTFTEIGSYTVMLTATTECSGVSIDKTFADYISVEDAPDAAITYNGEASICPEENISLGAVVSEGASYSWLINDVEASEFENAALSDLPDAGTDNVYTLIATSPAGCVKEVSLSIAVKETCDTIPKELPNVITPNNDNLNDFWFIPWAETNTNITVEIYNRWGQKVWFVKSYDNNSRAWKGTNTDGEQLPDGTYYYVINFNNGEAVQKGHISIFSK